MGARGSLTGAPTDTSPTGCFAPACLFAFVLRTVGLKFCANFPLLCICVLAFGSHGNEGKQQIGPAAPALRARGRRRKQSSNSAQSEGAGQARSHHGHGLSQSLFWSATQLVSVLEQARLQPRPRVANGWRESLQLSLRPGECSRQSPELSRVVPIDVCRRPGRTTAATAQTRRRWWRRRRHRERALPNRRRLCVARGTESARLSVLLLLSSGGGGADRLHALTTIHAAGARHGQSKATAAAAKGKARPAL